MRQSAFHRRGLSKQRGREHAYEVEAGELLFFCLCRHAEAPAAAHSCLPCARGKGGREEGGRMF